MKKFILRLSYLILPLLILELCITIIKDPGEIISNRYIKIKDVLLTNQNVRLYAMTSQWGEFQEAYVQERSRRHLPAFDVVTWGSSRSAEMGADLFPQATYYNCVIPGANVLSYVSMYELYKRNNYLPSTVIINIDPWTFYMRKEILDGGRTYSVRDKNQRFNSNMHLNDYLAPGLADLNHSAGVFPSKNSWNTILQRYIELLSPSYFQSSLKVITKSPVAVTSENYILGYFVLRKDGSYTMYAPNREEIEKINDRALNFSKLARGNFYGDDCTEGESMELFISLLDRLKEKQVRVILFISPIHPSLYDALEGHESNLVEQKLKTLTKEKGMLLIGSYNPHRYKLEALVNDPDFLDEYHISHKAMKTIFAHHQDELLKYQHK